MALCHKRQSALRKRKRNRLLMYRDHRPCAMVSKHQPSRSVLEDADTGINIDGLGHKHQSAHSRRSLKERKAVQRTVSKSDFGRGKVRMRGSLPSHPGSLCRLLLEIEAEVWLVCRMSLAAYSKQATFPLTSVLYIIMCVLLSHSPNEKADRSDGYQPEEPLGRSLWLMLHCLLLHS